MIQLAFALITALFGTLLDAGFTAKGGVTPRTIDALLAAAQHKAEVAAAPACDDETFLRRVSLDVRGVIPTPDEAREFAADHAPDKRPRVIALYLQSPWRGDHWADYWTRLLVGSLDKIKAPRAREEALAPWQDWVADQFNANVPFDQFVSTIVTSEGPADRVPAVLPVARWEGEPQDVVGAFSRVFLGRQIQCAQCHDHPYDKTFTREEFWQAAAFFGGAEVREVRNSTGRPVTAQVIDRPRDTVEIPDTTPPLAVQAVYTDGTRVDATSSASPRVQFAQCLVRNDRRQFAANMMNRLWARYFGRGFVEPVDEWFGTPEPSTPEVLDALATEFLASGFDLRHMEQLVLNTEAYQRAARTTGPAGENPELFAAAAVRPLTGEQLLESLARATSLEDIAANVTNRRRPVLAQRLMERYKSQFLYTFASDENEYRNLFEPSIPQTLFLLNDEHVNTTLSAAKGSTLARILSAESATGPRVDALYLAALSRRPTPGEREFLVGKIDRLRAEGRATARDEKAIFEDAFWALANSTEFLTNH